MTLPHSETLPMTVPIASRSESPPRTKLAAALTEVEA
jgi:hypothetical protein